MATLLLKYCGPKCLEKGETQAVVVDLVASLGFFCANNRKHQVSGKMKIISFCHILGKFYITK